MQLRPSEIHILMETTQSIFSGSVFLPDTEPDLQNHPCLLQYPEVRANLCLPSLQARQGARSDQLDLDDPGTGREGRREHKVRQKHWNKFREHNNICTNYPFDKSNFHINESVISVCSSPEGMKVFQPSKNANSPASLCTMSARYCLISAYK